VRLLFSTVAEILLTQEDQLPISAIKLEYPLANHEEQVGVDLLSPTTFNWELAALQIRIFKFIGVYALL
jgi:hypothetical protein